MPGVFGAGALALALGYAALGSSAGVTAVSTTTLEVERGEFRPAPEITAKDSRPEAIPAAPGGAAPRLSDRESVGTDAGRSTLQAYCSPSSFRLLAAAMERGFESSQAEYDLILHVDSDRNCVGHLLMGTADIAVIGSPLSTQERQSNLVAQTMGHRIMVPIIHTTNPVNSVCYDDFRAMLSGTMTGWSRVGGQRLEIEPVCEAPSARPDLAASNLRFADRLAGSTVFMHSHSEILGYVSNNPRGLGLVSKTSVDGVRIVKVLQIDQIKPTMQLFREGAWRFGSTFRTIHATQPSPGARAWIKYLSTESARRITRRVMTLPE